MTQVLALMTFNIPPTPPKGILRNQESDTKISHNLQKKNRSGVESLLYLVKHSGPKLSNMVCELSKCIDEANIIHYKALLCAIKYLVDMKGYCYQMKLEVNLNGPW